MLAVTGDEPASVFYLPEFIVEAAEKDEDPGGLVES